jgi:hypothetical protein
LWWSVLLVEETRVPRENHLTAVPGENHWQVCGTRDKVYQLLAHGQWFSPVTSASSTTKTDRHDIAEILLKVALNTINQISKWKWTFIRIGNRLVWVAR